MRAFKAFSLAAKKSDTESEQFSVLWFRVPVSGIEVVKWQVTIIFMTSGQKFNCLDCFRLTSSEHGDVTRDLSNK